MKTSELPNGTVIKFKNPAKIHSFYDRYDWDKHGFMGHSDGSLMTILINPNDIITIVKTSIKDQHVGQTVVLPNGSVKVLYYHRDTFLDDNRSSLEGLDVVANEYFYDILEA